MSHGQQPRGPGPQAASRKRRREPASVDVKLVEIYEDLANPKDDIRLAASRELVLRFLPEKKPSGPDVEKCLKRLFRGLCSGRKAARIGFSVALTEVLTQVFRLEERAVTLASVVEIWLAQSNVAGDAAGQVGMGYMTATFYMRS